MKICLLIRKHVNWGFRDLLDLKVNEDHRKAHEEFYDRTRIIFRVLRSLVSKASLDYNNLKCNQLKSLGFSNNCTMIVIYGSRLGPEPIHDHIIDEILINEYDVIIPMDDDDFIFVDTLKLISGIQKSRLRNANFIVWNSLEYDYVTGEHRVGMFIKPEDSPFGGIEDLILPSSYGIIVNKSDSIQDIRDKINIFSATPIIKKAIYDNKTIDTYGIGAFRPCYLATEYYLTDNTAISHLNEIPNPIPDSETGSMIARRLYCTIKDGEKLSKVCYPGNP